MSGSGPPLRLRHDPGQMEFRLYLLPAEATAMQVAQLVGAGKDELSTTPFQERR